MLFATFTSSAGISTLRSMLLLGCASFFADFIQGSLQPAGELLRLVIPPEVEKEEARRLKEHMAVHGSNSDAVVDQRLNHWIYFAPNQDEIAGSGCLVTDHLQVDAGCHPEIRRHLHPLFNYFFLPGKAHLEDVPFFR